MPNALELRTGQLVRVYGLSGGMSSAEGFVGTVLQKHAFGAYLRILLATREGVVQVLVDPAVEAAVLPRVVARGSHS